MQSPPSLTLPTQQMSKAIIKRLRAFFKKESFEIARTPTMLTFDEYSKRVSKRAPFLGLSLSGVNVAPISGAEMEARYQWSLACFLRMTGNIDARFKGDVYSLGLDDITDAAIAVLHNANFTDIGRLEVKNITSRYTPDWGDMACVIANIDFEISTSFGYGELNLDELPAFLGANNTLEISENDKCN